MFDTVLLTNQLQHKRGIINVLYCIIKLQFTDQPSSVKLPNEENE